MSHTKGQADGANGHATPFQAIVVGAGLAGLAAAIALRGEGREVTVLESSRLKSEIGAAIHLAPNATKIVQKWGLDVRQKARATVCREIREVAGNTGAIRFKAPIDTEKAFGAPWLFQHRVDLHNAFLDFATDASQPGKPAQIVTSAKVTDIDCEQGRVKTADGKTYEADLIIGADGIHSEVRKAVLGGLTVAQPSGHSAYRCLIPKEKIAHIQESAVGIDVDHSILQIVIHGDRRVIIYPCRDASIMNIVAICPDKFTNEESTQSWNQQGSTAEMVKAFEGFAPWVIETLSQAETPGLWQLRDQDPLPTWVKGRAILVGDAAHSMLPHQGQGAGQAVEDAEAIGAFFDSVHGSLDASAVESKLKEIFDARIQRASTIQAYSRQQALPAGEGSFRVDLDSMKFAGYNMSYAGVKDWIARQAAAPQATAA